MFDGFGREMPNTLPSTPDVPYNLHDGDPVVSKIDPTSPTDDLLAVLESVKRLPPNPVQRVRTAKITAGAKQTSASDEEIKRTIQRGLDILEGNPIKDRPYYSGLPLLHYKGPEKCKKVIAIRDVTGKVIGGNVNIHQVW